MFRTPWSAASSLFPPPPHRAHYDSLHPLLQTHTTKKKINQIKIPSYMFPTLVYQILHAVPKFIIRTPPLENLIQFNSISWHHHVAYNQNEIKFKLNSLIKLRKIDITPPPHSCNYYCCWILIERENREEKLTL